MRSILFCPVCGSPNASSREYCSACEENLRNPTVQLPAPESAVNPFVESGLAGIVSGAILAVVILIFCFQLIRWQPVVGIGASLGTVVFALISIGNAVRGATRATRFEFRRGLALGFGTVIILLLFLAAGLIGLAILCFRAFGLDNPNGMP